MSKDPKRIAAQLRVMLRRWRQRAFIGVALAVLSTFALSACWFASAHPFWWVASAMALISAGIEIFGDINAFQDTQKRIRQLESDQQSHAA